MYTLKYLDTLHNFLLYVIGATICLICSPAVSHQVSGDFYG
jgi:hypothetical protein